MWVKAAVVAIALTLAGLVGWTAQGWRKDAVIAELKQKHEAAISKASDDALALQQTRDNDHAAVVSKITAVDASATFALTKAQNETDRLRNCVRTGTCGLRIAATCPAAASGVMPSAPADPGSSSMAFLYAATISAAGAPACSRSSPF